MKPKSVKAVYKALNELGFEFARQKDNDFEENIS